MNAIGIICEYNPFHNGHLYHINEAKKVDPDAVTVLVVGGYFLQRGEVSLMSKWNKTALALKYGVNLVVELPVLYGTNSADYFAHYAIEILNECGVSKIVFGSECNDIDLLKNIAVSQSDEAFNEKVREELKKGSNYPSSLAGVLEVKLESNDLLGVSYIKAIQSINPSIEAVSIKRTNCFNDVLSESNIVSAQNIRAKLDEGAEIAHYIPGYDKSLINKINKNKLFELLRYKILTDRDLSRYLGVDEGLENKMKSVILNVSSYEELLEAIKSKRYTTSRLRRMLIHVLIGIEKEDMKIPFDEYKILGFDNLGKAYLRQLNSKRLVYKSDNRIREIENVAALLYRDLTGDGGIDLEFYNKPIIKD